MGNFLTHRIIRISTLTLALVVLLWLMFARTLPAHATGGVVGTGTPASCTETAFDMVFYNAQSSGGGLITFNCGAALHTIVFSTNKNVSANTIIDGGGLITLSGGNATSIFQIFASPTLSLRDISLTRAYGTYGAIQNFGTLNLSNARFVLNTATMNGGAIDNSGVVNMSNTTIASNSAGQYGGGIHNESGTVTIISSQLYSNTAVLGGGGINSADTLFVANSQLYSNSATSSFPDGEGGGIRSAGMLSLTNSSLYTHNASRGGALFVASGTATVTRSTFTYNIAAYGGAIRHVGGDLFVRDVLFDHNGYSPTGYPTTTGGGALSRDTGGNAWLTNVTMSNNYATYGGGLDHRNGNTTLTNVTISGNASVGSGGMDQDGGVVTMTNVTLYGNSSSFFGVLGNRAGALIVNNTLVTNSKGANCNKPIVNNSFSLSSDNTCGFGAGRDNVIALLAPLANNGGFTPTHLPFASSPAIDNGTGIGCPATDQRGVTRPQGVACDIGAVEYRTGEVTPWLYLPLIVQ